jgi:hypothetical protein
MAAHAVARDAACGVGRVEEGRYVKPGTVVVILLILAALASNMREPGMLPVILFAAAAAVAVGAMSYRKRYSAVQRDTIESPQPASPLTQDRRNGALMRPNALLLATVGGLLGFVVGVLWPWLLLPFDESGWLLVTVGLWLVSMGASAKLTDWLLRSSRCSFRWATGSLTRLESTRWIGRPYTTAGG